MEIEPPSAWDVPRPAVRLWLTLVLGSLGALLIPCSADFFYYPFSNFQGATALAWMSAAFAAVLLLRLLEKARIPWRLAVLMGLALALCPAIPRGSGEEERGFLAGLAWLFCLGVLLMMAGVSASGVQFPRRSIRAWAEVLMRGPAIAVAAPLLLYASRPTTGGRSFSVKAAFAVFPCVVAASFTLPNALVLLDCLEYDSKLALSCFAFGTWAWLGCALLFLLSPWPEHPRIPGPDEPSETRMEHHLAAAIGLVMVLLFLWEEGPRRFLWLIGWASLLPGLWAWLGLALLLTLSPWPGRPRLPKLGALPRARRAGPLGTVVFLGLALAPLGVIACGPLLHFLGGGLFSLGFDRVHAGHAIDQPTIGKWLFLFTILTAVVLPHVAVARWMSDRRTRWGRWAFAVPTGALLLCLLIILTVPFHWLIQYIWSMGFTSSRAGGVVYCLCGYALVLGCGMAWLDFIPSGYRYQRFLHHQGYEWATAADARRILRHLRWDAHRVPPSCDVETLPGSSPDAQSLIDFMTELARHKRQWRRRR